MILVFNSFSRITGPISMLDEYKNSDIWSSNPDEISLRSDILVTKRVIDLLGNVSSKKILDAGCGNGKVSRLLAKAGASVVGVDKIEDQIVTAKITNPELGIKYFVGDISNLDALGLPDDFDTAVSLMTFLYLDKNEFIQAAQQIRNHLKPGNRFIYGNIDPYRFDADKDANLDKIEKLEAELPTVSGKVFKTTFYKHPYSFVVKTFTEASFRIKSEIKPKETENEAQTYPMLFPKSATKSQYLILDMEAI